MTFHKITDTHILDCGGSPRSLLTPIPMTRIITHLNWDAQWNFVFKKTIPFFWYPAHTITFLLPGEMRGAVCSDIGCGARGIAGYCGSDEIIRPIYSRMISSKSCG